MKPIPDTVKGEKLRDLYAQAQNLRAALKEIASEVSVLRAGSVPLPQSGIDGEVIANATIALRHVEDASHRLGKVLQHLDGGVSVYDRATTVGA